MTTTIEDVIDFLSCKRLALVGVSRQDRDFSRSLFREFVRRGYDVVPVNPHATEVEGRRCFVRLEDIKPPVEGAMVMTKPDMAGDVIRECRNAGIGRVWLYRSQISYQAEGMRVISNHCPFMFWKDSGKFHHFHGFLLKITGKYPG